MDKTEEKFIRLTTRPLFSLLAALSAPAVASMLITAIYNAADSYFVSTVNDTAVGSVGVVFSFMAVLQAVGFIAIGAAGLIFIEPLAKFLGSTDTILPYAKNYLKYILIASPFQTSALTLNNQLRFQGNTKHGLIGLGVGAVLNMGLDPLFILVFGMNTDGAGLATMRRSVRLLPFC